MTSLHHLFNNQIGKESHRTLLSDFSHQLDDFLLYDSPKQSHDFVLLMPQFALKLPRVLHIPTLQVKGRRHGSQLQRRLHFLQRRLLDDALEMQLDVQEAQDRLALSRRVQRWTQKFNAVGEDGVFEKQSTGALRIFAP